jgi:phenylacetate-CoA ligase
MAILSPHPCPCGRATQVLQEVVGKKHDILLTADGRFVYGGFFTRLFRLRPEVTRFQVYQPNRESLEVRFICNQEVGDTWLEELHNAIQEHFGASMRITLLQVDDIALTPAGKHRFIISDVEPEFSP